MYQHKYLKYKSKYSNLTQQSNKNNFLKVSFQDKLIQPNQIINLSNVQTKPKVEFEHDPKKLYTIIMVDPDAPSKSNPIYKYFLHWLVVNDTDTVVKFKPSDPPLGSGLHRYYIYVFEQVRGLIDVDSLHYETRQNFDLELFIRNQNLTLVSSIMYLSEKN